MKKYKNQFLSLLLGLILCLTPCVCAAQPAYAEGDVDNNGTVAAPDALLVLQKAVEIITLDEAQTVAADVDEDGVINALDALYILQYAVKKISSFDGVKQFSVYSPEGEVYPYSEKAREYLLEGAGANILQYDVGAQDFVAPVSFYWNLKDRNTAKALTLEYGLKEDFSDAIAVSLEPTDGVYNIYNLYKASDYFWRMTATLADGEKLVRTGTMKTSDLGPRVMFVEGLYNMRDIGGYVSSINGKRIRQGLIFRGGGTWKDSIFPHNLTQNGKDYMSNVLGIQTELDVRDIKTLTNPPEESVIPGASLKYAALNGYNLGETSSLSRIFNLLSNEENYPFYIHCTGGMDRTGTAMFLIGALLGISEQELIQDYELSSLTVYGQRPYSQHMQAMHTALQTYSGETLAEKAAHYVNRLGISQEKIETIRSIMIEDYQPAE